MSATMRVCRSMSIGRVDDEAYMVYGVAATEKQAPDGLTIPMSVIKEAWESGYGRWRTLREQHIVEGTPVGEIREYRFDDELGQLEIGAHVSESRPDVWQRIKDGTLKGFSIMGDILGKVGSIVTSLRLVEISLVDQPEDSGAAITLYRAANARDENNNRGQSPEGGKMPIPTAPQGGKVKRDASGDGDVTQQIADNEGSPLDTQLDVIGLLMQEFGKIKDLVDSLSSGDGVHPDVLANCMRAHQALGRAINSHVSATTAYGKKDGEGDDTGDGSGDAGGDAGQGAAEDGAAKRAASIAARNAAIKRAANGELDARISKLTESVETLLKRSADPRAGYTPAVAPTTTPDARKTGDDAKPPKVTEDEFGPLEGTPEFAALPKDEQFDVVCRRANPTFHAHKS